MTGIILSGGRNTRINLNKAFLKINNTPIIEIILDKFKEIFHEIVIVTNSQNEYRYLGEKLVKDIIPNKGSLGGLYSGLVNSHSEYNFVVACDMPFLNPGLIKNIIGCKDSYDIVIPRLNMRILPNKGYETMHAVYSKNCIKHIEEQLNRDNLKIINFFDKVKLKEIGEDVVNRFDSRHLSFININTDADYHKALLLHNDVISGNQRFLNIAPSLRTYKDSL